MYFCLHLRGHSVFVLHALTYKWAGKVVQFLRAIKFALTVIEDSFPEKALLFLDQ